MCGIAGFLDVERRIADPAATLARMSSMIAHRGPDDRGEFVDPPVHLAHRRLSVIDLATGHQPMTDAAGRHVIVFNGEIYNYRELRGELERSGATFRTRSDTEVILAGYAARGTEFFGSLNGMFALALWDRERRELVLARDRLGVKPLYRATADGTFWFASEVKAIQAVRPFELATEVLPDYVAYGYVPAPKTLLRGIEALPPGSWLKIAGGRVTEGTYWTFRYRSNGPRSEGELLEDLDTRLRSAVRRQMVSDVPIGAFLSGGVDSSLVVALMSEAASRPIKTFSIGFPEEGGNEFRWSREVAHRFATEHMEVEIDADRFLELLPEAIWLLDEPLRHDAGVALLELAGRAKREATVVLTGEGSDELFLGYFSFRRAADVWRWTRLLPGIPPALVARRYLGGTPARYVERALGRSRTNGTDPVVDAFRESTAPSRLGQLGEAYIRQYLPTLLTNQDRMSMAAAVESRVPFLDNDVVDWALELPVDWRIRDGIGKYLLKKLARRYFSDDFVYRKKMGFPVPVELWLREGVVRERVRATFAERRFPERGLVDAPWVISALERLPSIRSERERQRIGSVVWRIFELETWARLFLDRSGPLSASAGAAHG